MGHDADGRLIKFDDWKSFYLHYLKNEFMDVKEPPACCYVCPESLEDKGCCQHTEKHICIKLSSRIHHYFWDRNDSKLHLSFTMGIFTDICNYQITVTEDDHNFIQIFIKFNMFYPNIYLADLPIQLKHSE
jgi:hypothetical protein